jgi:hypothetical protein
LEYFNSARQKTKPISPSTFHEYAALANEAVSAALRQLDSTPDNFSKFDMYFIASRLFRETGHVEGMRRCNRFLKRSVLSCESNSTTDIEQIKASVSVLNLIAFELIPVRIPDLNPKKFPNVREPKLESFTEKDFKESEELKLRTTALVDRLPPDNDLRRRTHRDLALWYGLLGKNELADKEKRVLFRLVGCDDDIILYPQSAACGSFVWWSKVELGNSVSCGMG